MPSTSPQFKSRMKIEFKAQEEKEMTMVEYQASFFTLERFAPGSFATERERG